MFFTLCIYASWNNLKSGGPFSFIGFHCLQSKLSHSYSPIQSLLSWTCPEQQLLDTVLFVLNNGNKKVSHWLRQTSLGCDKHKIGLLRNALNGSFCVLKKKKHTNNGINKP